MRKTLLFLMLLCTFLPMLAQGQSGTLSGKVTDQTGAVIPQATVTATAPDGKQTAATTNHEGSFQIRLAPGTYNVSAGATGFATFEKSGVEVAAGHGQSLNLSLEIQAQQENVEVQGEPTTLDVGASSNANAIILKGKDLEALSDDPDELQSELQALAGPAAGPNGGQIYIDGFTGGQLPPKSAIREIRINQNPFSAQYDKLGYGRVEILTKPGSEQLHGQIFFNDTNAVLNSGNPFVRTPKPSYNTDMFDGSVGGPINKKASFFIDASRRDLNDYAAIYAVNPADLFGNYLQDSIHTPETRTSFSPRVDYQLTPSNTLTVRYQLTHNGEQNSGVGGTALPSMGYNLNETEHTVQITDNQVLSPKVVNETRFQFQRETNHQLPLGFGPEINVQGDFTDGENSQGRVLTSQNSYELQNYTQMTRSKHVITFGARLRGITASESTDANFNGTFVFSPVRDPQTGLEETALEAYNFASQKKCVSGTAYSPLYCPSQFSIATGSPQVSVGWLDAGVYAEDEWRVKPNLSVTYGLRFESQNDVHDHADFAPRIGVAWGLGSTNHGTPKTVVRGGFGIFYDRFGYNLVEQANLLNGVTQQSVTIRDPQFFIPNPQSLPFSSLQQLANPTIYQISPNLRAPYTMQSAVSIERQITKAATVSLTYLNSRGEHSFFVDNVGYVQHMTTPNGLNENVYQYQSGGIFRQNQLIANFRVNTGRRFSLFGFYMLNYANSDTSSGGSASGFFASGTSTMASFVSNQSNPLADYGRAAFDIRSRLFLFGSISLPQSFSLNPFVIIDSGEPYNLTTGQDNNGDSIYNDRPWFANGTSNVSCTSSADFSETPTQFGEVPINYCTGPANVTFNLRLAKTISFGRETKGGFSGGGGRGMGGGPRGGLGPRGLSGGGGNPFAMGGGRNRRYSLTFSIFARNLFNSVNPGPPVGNLSARNFGISSMIGGGPFGSATANRRVDLQVRFSF